MWIDIIKQHFPNSNVNDAAMRFPITNGGWDIEFPDSVDGTTVLVLQDMLTWREGTRWPQEFEKITTWAIARGIDQSKIIVIIWNYDLAEHWNSQNPDAFTCIQFSPFQYNLWKQYTANRNVLENTFTGTGRKHTALCLNRMDKPHRRHVVAGIKRFRGINYSDQHRGREPYYAGLKYDDYKYDNLANLLSLSRNYTTSKLSIITESQYYEPRGIITEKTFNAIVALHPFLLVSSAGSVGEVKRLGFGTFGEYFSEEYDEAPNGARINKVLETTVIHKFTPDAKLSELTVSNRNYFFDSFGDKLLLDLDLACKSHSRK